MDYPRTRNYIRNVSFNAPHYPDPLVIYPGTKKVKVLNRHKQYQEQKRAYLKHKNVEKVFQQHIKDNIKEKYLETPIDEDTQLIQEDIPVVLAYLFETYGEIPSKKVKQKEAEIHTMTCHPADPMILLFNPF